MSTVLLILGCLAVGAVMGFFLGQAAIAYATLHNTGGFRDRLKKKIAKAEGMDRAERAMQSMLDELRAKKEGR